MHLETLKVFCDIIVHNSFSVAAEVNHVSQSAASQAVHKLERHLGCKLIDRSHRPWRITRQGKVCYQHSREVLDRYFKMEAALRDVPENHHTELRLAAIYSVGFAYLHEHLEEVQDSVDGAHVQVNYLHPEEVLRRVLEDETELGILSFPPRRRELVVIPWLEEEMVVACAPTHLLAQWEEIAPEDLAAHDLAGFDRGLPIGEEIARFLKGCDIRPRVTARFDNVEAVKRAIEGGNQVAILPRPTLNREIQSRTLVARRLTVPFTRPLGIIRRRGMELTAPMARLIEHLKNV